MTLPCQVLSNLNNCVDWIDNDELRELFQELVGNPSPSLTQQFDQNKLKSIDDIAYSLLLQRCGYAVIVAHETWFVHSYDLSIEDATTIEIHINESHSTLRATVVPDEAAMVMQGWEVESVSFDKGNVIILPILHQKKHVIPVNMDDLDWKILNNHYLWNELGLHNFRLDKLQQNFTCIGCNKVEQVPATWDYIPNYLCNSCTQEAMDNDSKSKPMTDEELKYLINKQQEIADYGHDLSFEFNGR